MEWMSRRSPSLIAAVPVVLAMAVLAAACSSTPQASTAPSRSAAPSTGGGGGVPAVPATLDFTAPKLGGGTLNGADYAGQDTAIWFWAPW